LKLSVVILAAGQGKRMNSDLPKVLQPLAGRPLLAHVIESARQLDPQSIHVVYGHGGEHVRQALTDAPAQWVLQAEQLGTGHALMQAMPAIADDETVLVLYGDVPLVQPATLTRLLAQADERSVAVLSVVLEDAAGYGRILRDASGKVVRIVEEKDATAKERAIREVNTGLLAARAGHLRRWLGALRNDNAQAEYYLTDVVVAAVKEGLRINGVVVTDATEVLGINDKVQLAEAEAAHRRRKANELMLAGVTLADPARFDVRGTVTVGRDVYIDVNVVLVGNVKLGDRVRIGPNCYLKDCEIGAGTELFPNCVMDRAVIGPGCQVGPFARLRPGTVLHQDVHIGNFVEVKKSEIGAGSKANHLTYIGDAIVGSKVNVGAGTITCNYDGANKWRTEIGDGAFIGSGTMLIAPIQIGSRATIGAGSVITRPAPADKLTLERGKQVTIDGWKPPTKQKPET
jgi:bifunctional UDP-N-acetylglucosamine pyrophosphorylase/glucosamine-1-phosphate N-acetyltransferase